MGTRSGPTVVRVSAPIYRVAGVIAAPHRQETHPWADPHPDRARRAAPTSARVPAGRTAHPNGTVPVTPTAAAGMTAVAGVVATRARQRLKNAIVTSLDECIAAADGSIAHPNAHDARPFRWRRDPGASWTRGHRRVQEMEVSV